MNERLMLILNSFLECRTLVVVESEKYDVIVRFLVGNQ